MATWETQLLSRIIRTGDINSVLRWGITYEDFNTSEGRMLFTHLVNYYQMPETSGSILGPSALQQSYPTFQIVDDPSMTVDALCSEVRKSRFRTELRMLMQNAEKLIDVDPTQALNLVAATTTFLQQLGTSRKLDVHAIDAMTRIMQRYDMREKGVDLSICPWPWEPLQDATGGIEPDDYVVIYGRPKSMKSWVLAYLIGHVYELGKKTLIYTKEMTPDNIIARVVAIMASIRYHEFRRGRLAPNEKAALYEAWRVLHHLKEVQNMVCLSGKDAGEGGDTVPWLRSKVEQYKPDLVFVDGMYLMSNARSGRKGQKDNERVRDISRDLSQLRLDTGVPVIATIQANRDAAKNTDANLDEVAFSDAIGQDATLAMRVINDKDAPTLSLVVGGSREFYLDGFSIYGVPATNFSYAGPLTALDVQRAKSADGDAAAAKKSKTKKARAQSSDEEAQLQQSTEAAIAYLQHRPGGGL
jgi:replicative DNA helicase